MEFTYNNSYQTTIGMIPYEALYGQRCHTLLCQEEIGDKEVIKLELIQITTKKIMIIMERMKVAQDRHKSYADNRQRSLEFDVRDKLFLKVV